MNYTNISHGITLLYFVVSGPGFGLGFGPWYGPGVENGSGFGPWFGNGSGYGKGSRSVSKPKSLKTYDYHPYLSFTAFGSNRYSVCGSGNTKPLKKIFYSLSITLPSNLRMMSEMSEDDFECMLDQFCADSEPATGTENQREVELVVVDGPAEDADDDIIMLPQTSEPAVTLSPPAPSGEEKVNENLSICYLY